MTQAILFDFWGTLVENGVWSPVKQVKNILNLNLPFSEYVVRMEKAMMTHQFSELREAFLAVCEEFKISVDEDKIEELIGMWNKSWMLAQPYPEVEEVLSKLRGSYQLVLVSNTDCFSVPRVLEKFGLKKYFDQIFLSCETGLIKTDKDFFNRIAEKMGLQIDDCVMVGDSFQSDIIPAKDTGMKAILIDRKNARDFSPRIKTLKELEQVL